MVLPRILYWFIGFYFLALVGIMLLMTRFFNVELTTFSTGLFLLFALFVAGLMIGVYSNKLHMGHFPILLGSVISISGFLVAYGSIPLDFVNPLTNELHQHEVWSGFENTSYSDVGKALVAIGVGILLLIAGFKMIWQNLYWLMRRSR